MSGVLGMRDGVGLEGEVVVVQWQHWGKLCCPGFIGDDLIDLGVTGYKLPNGYPECKLSNVLLETSCLNQLALIFIYSQESSLMLWLMDLSGQNVSP